MHFYPQLVLGILVVLMCATIIGRTLKRRYSPHVPNAVIDNMNARIAAWWGIATLVLLASWFGAVGLALLFAAASLQALREYIPEMARRTPIWAAMLAAVVMQYALAATGHSVGLIIALPAIVTAIVAMSVLRRRQASRSPAFAGALLLCVYCISHVPALATLDGASTALGPPLFLVIVVQASDVMQYITGKLAGRHPIAPKLSPGKTVEGALGGLLGAGVLGACLSPMMPYGVGASAALALGLAALGIVGGLLFSAMKRKRGIKDWGDIIPGHGGVLDRLDSLCLSAPMLYHLMRVTHAS